MSRVEVKNAADPEQVEKSTRRTRRRENAKLETYRAVMRTPAGRAVMWDLLERAGLYVTSYSQIAMQMARDEGRRGFGLEILGTLLELGDGLYLEMEREARNQEARDDAETEASHVKPVSEQERVQ